MSDASETALSPPREEARPRAAYGEARGTRDDGARGHLPILDGVRALSILLVLAAHMLPLGPSAWQLNATAGPAGMSLFFTLSGFLIVRFLWSDQRIAPFLVKRVSRIAPIATIYAAATCLVLSWHPEAFVQIVTYTKNYLHAEAPGTGPLWSLCVEMHFYAGIALLVALCGRRGLWAVPALAVLFTLVRVASGAEINIKTHLRVDEILTGGCLALAHIQLADRPDAMAKVRQWSGVAVWPLALAFAVACHPLFGPLAYLRPYLGTLVVASCLYTPFAWLRAVLCWGVLAYIAKVSYAVYIFHSGAMLGWLGEGGTAEKYLIKRPISLALTFALAHLSTNTVERWFNEAGRRFVRERYPAPAAA